jgi:hypothetical protein
MGNVFLSRHAVSSCIHICHIYGIIISVVSAWSEGVSCYETQRYGHRTEYFLYSPATTALRSGDPSAVRWMFQLLTQYAVFAKMSVERLKEQLETEYGVNLDAAADMGEVTLVTAEEIAIVERSGKVRAEDHDWYL